MKKKISLKDIAQKVGVSTALVSYVLNNKKEGRISKAVSERIRETALELNYRTNHIARSLKTRKTFTIGLIVADISNAFSACLARIIEDEAERHQYTVLFGSSDENTERSFKLINILLNHQVDGFIISPSENSEKEILFLQENEIPFVMLDRYYPQANASYVAIDNRQAAFNAVDHLVKQGNKRIGIITYKTPLFHLQERKVGYMLALEHNNIQVQREWIREVDMFTIREQVEQAVESLLRLQTPVDAILFASNTISTYALKYLNGLNIKVPDELAIVAFDESDAADLFYAPLTHIRQPLREMGQLATQTLLQTIDNNELIRKINLPAELVIRTSSLRI